MPPFPHHPQRWSVTLDGLWDFAWLGDLPMASLEPADLDFPEAAAVPGVFDAGGRHGGARGIGVYRRKVRLRPSSAGRHCRLDIGALGLRGRGWWDGKLLGDVDIPYDSRSFEWAVDKADCHDLVIAVDNRFDAERSPLFPPYSDFYAYGGMYRSVVLSELPAVRIERTVVTTQDLQAGAVRLKICLAGTVPASLPMRVSFDDGPREQLDCHPRQGIVELDRIVPGAKPWTVDRPELHTVMIEIDGDAIVERFGLRTIQAKEGAILLNGTPLRLKGVNRHESHPQFGPVQPSQLLVDDLTTIKDLGCNFIRAVHYPQAPEFLDLCDQLGLLVWEESLGWQIGEAELLSPTTTAQLAKQTRHMIRDGINHPSIIIWAFLNECPSNSEKVKPVYAELASLVRSEDPTRLVSYASNRGEKDRCFSYVDVVAWNLYPGWFEPRSWTETSISMIAPYVDQIAGLSTRPDIAGKPMLVSEIGACALYGYRDRCKAQWSEEFQADYLGEACHAVLADPRWAGVVLWQFCDTRSHVGVGDVRGKPRGFNNAGLFDEYRRPKLAAARVGASFTEEHLPTHIHTPQEKELK